MEKKALSHCAFQTSGCHLETLNRQTSNFCTAFSLFYKTIMVGVFPIVHQTVWRIFMRRIMFMTPKAHLCFTNLPSITPPWLFLAVFQVWPFFYLSTHALFKEPLFVCVCVHSPTYFSVVSNFVVCGSHFWPVLTLRILIRRWSLWDTWMYFISCLFLLVWQFVPLSPFLFFGWWF
jgi:hypothetical protein